MSQPTQPPPDQRCIQVTDKYPTKIRRLGRSSVRPKGFYIKHATEVTATSIDMRKGGGGSFYVKVGKISQKIWFYLQCVTYDYRSPLFCISGFGINAVAQHHWCLGSSVIFRRIINAASCSDHLLEKFRKQSVHTASTCTSFPFPVARIVKLGCETILEIFYYILTWIMAPVKTQVQY